MGPETSSSNSETTTRYARATTTQSGTGQVAPREAAIYAITRKATAMTSGPAMYAARITTTLRTVVEEAIREALDRKGRIAVRVRFAKTIDSRRCQSLRIWANRTGTRHKRRAPNNARRITRVVHT